MARPSIAVIVEDAGRCTIYLDAITRIKEAPTGVKIFMGDGGMEFVPGPHAYEHLLAQISEVESLERAWPYEVPR